MLKKIRIFLWVATILFFMGGLCAEPTNATESAYQSWLDSLDFYARWFLILLITAIFFEVVNYIGKKAIQNKNKPQKF